MRTPFTLPKRKGTVFEDSFDADKNGLVPSGWTDVLTGMTVSNSQLVAADSPNGQNMYLTMVNINDFYCEIEFEKLSQSNAYAGIAGRWDGIGDTGTFYPRNGYLAFIHNTSTVGLRLDKSVNGVITTLAINTNLYTVTKGILGLRFRGPTIEVYLNGSKQLSVTDTTFTTGKTGVAARYSKIGSFRGELL